MFRRAFILFFLLSANLFVFGQGDTLLLSVEDIDDNQMLISNASAADYWKYHSRHNSEWKASGLDDSDWESITPATLSLDMADETGKVEGWFRLKFKLDASLDSIPLFFHVRDFGQALDIFLNGQRLHTHGQLESDSTTFQGALMRDIYTFVPVQLNADSVYTIALHYLHMPLGFPANLLETDGMLRFGFWLVNYNYMAFNGENRVKTLGKLLLRTTATAVITLLFWLFFLFNRKDVTILLISICVTGFFVIQAVGLLTSGSFPISITLFNLLGQLIPLGITVVLGSLPFIFAKILTGSYPRFLWLMPLLLIIHWIIRMTTTSGLGQIIFVILIGSIISICLYFIIRSWKGLRGAQWAVIIGILLFLLIFFANLMLSSYAPDGFNADSIISYLFYLGYMVFPFSLVVYVVMRFGESQEEVKNNAAQVVKVTEEKRQLALAQKEVLEKQVKERTEELSQSLNHLKSTQSQLIQSEKMASLGELTAGIAHEIQNPLNFVNNFSEVNTELIDELVEEINEGNYDEVKELARDIKSNEEKIKHHGSRADSIVKGMLKHSRTSTGEKTPTDINAICDEYLRLAYHGLRAKDNTFNAKMTTDFDESIGSINAVAQDISRVILNLITNAFQACSERSERTRADRSGGISADRSVSTSSSKPSTSAGQEYEPLVSVTTKRLNNSTTITVQDNGSGIPDAIKDKIFQPFFTTKDTGQGTGLGLSLAYDIVKAHGGEIKVESPPAGQAGTEGEGDEIYY